MLLIPVSLKLNIICVNIKISLRYSSNSNSPRPGTEVIRMSECFVKVHWLMFSIKCVSGNDDHGMSSNVSKVSAAEMASRSHGAGIKVFDP